MNPILNNEIKKNKKKRKKKNLKSIALTLDPNHKTIINL